jgi:hypothetical protein
LSQLPRVADVLGRVGVAQADADAEVVQPERVEGDLDEIEAARDLVLDLVLGRAEQVRVVDGERPDAGHARKLARLLPPVDGAELGSGGSAGRGRSAGASRRS